MKKNLLAVLLICIFVLTGVMSGCSGVTEPLTKEEIMEMSDDELCSMLYIQMVLSDIDLEEETGEAYTESVRAMNEAKEKFYILSDFDTEYYAGGLAEYLYYTDGAFVEDVEALLKEFGLNEMAEMFGDFFDENKIDFEKYKATDDNYDEYIEGMESEYPIEEFNEAFDEIYDDEKLYAALADYVRDNVDSFV